MLLIKIRVPSTEGSRMPLPKERQPPFNPLSILAMLAILFIIGLTLKPFLEVDDKGRVRLAKWRKEKLEKELKDLDKAEQYVLRAKRSGIFECFSCPNSNTIYLSTGQVWKYGVTTKGERGRYATTLEGKNLLYRIQLTGTLEECLKSEKIKIYNFAILPENLARDTPLIRLTRNINYSKL